MEPTQQPKPYVLTAASRWGTVLFDGDELTVRTDDSLETFPIEAISDVDMESPLLLGRGLFHFAADGRRITIDYGRRDAAQFGIMAATLHHALIG